MSNEPTIEVWGIAIYTETRGQLKNCAYKKIESRTSQLQFQTGFCLQKYSIVNHIRFFPYFAPLPLLTLATEY